MPSSARCRGSAWSRATRGIRLWNAVSKAATCDIPGPSAFRTARIAATAGPLWSGASSTNSSMATSTSASRSTGPEKRAPPWTTRWPTASKVPKKPEESSKRIAWWVASPWSAAAMDRSLLSPLSLMSSALPRPPILSTTPRAMDRSQSAASKRSNFSVELPQLMVRILTELTSGRASRSVAPRPDKILRGSLELFATGLGAEVVAFASVLVLQRREWFDAHPAHRIPLLPGETCLSHRLVRHPPSEQGSVEAQFVRNEPRQQEPLAHEFAALRTKLSCFLRVLQRPQRLLGALRHRIHQESTDSAPDLEWDPAGTPRYDRGFLPERLGDDQAEALADRLLDHHVGEPLKCIHLDVSHAGKVGEEVDVRVVLGRLPDLAVDLPPLRVVERHGARQRQLQPGYFRFDEPVGLYDT